MVLAAAVALALISVVAPGASAAGLPLTLVQSGLSRPLFVTNAGDARIFVVEQGGAIKIVRDDGSVSTFLNLTAIVSQDGGERGMLGLAFHPGYASNGLFYVTYVRRSDNRNVLAEYRVSADADVADPGSARVLMELKDPYSNHNGGWIDFHDGFLYMATGDGGGGGDPGNRAQSKRSLFGKILRISVADPDGAGPLRYSVPATNPYVGVAGKDEIFARGLRNPWRCSFDDATGNLWCADVGQDKYEEINRVNSGRGANFGWRKLEGRHIYRWSGHTAGSTCTGSCFDVAHCRVRAQRVRWRKLLGHGRLRVAPRRSGALRQLRRWRLLLREGMGNPANFASGAALPSPSRTPTITSARSARTRPDGSTWSIWWSRVPTRRVVIRVEVAGPRGRGAAVRRVSASPLP